MTTPKRVAHWRAWDRPDLGDKPAMRWRVVLVDRNGAGGSFEYADEMTARRVFDEAVDSGSMEFAELFELKE